MTATLFATSTLALVCAGCLADVSVDGVDEDEQLPDDPVTEIADASPDIAGCATVTTVMLYSESTNAFTLPEAFAAAVDPCTNYYVYLPAVIDSNGLKIEVRASADRVHALGPHFHAMAEFHWGAWHDWVAASPGTRDWRLAGQAFRQRMLAGGFDPARDIWAINEFPSATRTGEGDVWPNERAAVKGLADGDGTRTVRGAVFVAGMGEHLENFSVYQPSVNTWLQNDAWWTSMADNVAFFGYEVYADPHYNCVAGSNVPTDRANLNAYLEHIPRAAKAGGVTTATAYAYLRRHFVPLLGSAWNATVGFGDNRISFEDFAKFQRLQVYATHFWSSEHGSPGRRIGFAWSPKSATPAQEKDLAGIIAGSVGRAYPSNGFFNLGKLACSSSGSLSGCGCTTAGSYNDRWLAFGAD